MLKKISVGACVVTVMICCIVTFQATYIGLYNRFEKISRRSCKYDKYRHIDSVDIIGRHNSGDNVGLHEKSHG